MTYSISIQLNRKMPMSITRDITRQACLVQAVSKLMNLYSGKMQVVIKIPFNVSSSLVLQFNGLNEYLMSQLAIMIDMYRSCDEVGEFIFGTRIDANIG